jgi:HlyD family secretion protein
MVVVDGNSKKIQHQQGGVIGEILVRDGSRVSAGDLVVKLDDMQARALLGIVTSQLTELLGRKTRLAAERDDRDDLEFPPGFTTSGPEAERVASGERRLFHARLASANGQKAQLGERIKQNENEIKGLTLQNSAKAREVALIRDELSRVNDLYLRNLLPVTRVLSLQRDETRIEGEVGTLVSQIAKLGGQIAETRLQTIAIDQNRFSDAQKELREAEGRIAELQERKIAAEDQLRRVELRAPIDGIIHELSVHTVGGVVNPAEQLMLVVPSSDSLSVEVRVPSSDIDQLKIGRQGILRFTAFNQRTTPEVKGVVTRLSPDAVRDKDTGQFYYTARIAPDNGDLARLVDQKLVPGMPVEAFIETSPRTALSYLTKPLTDQFERAFRER